MIKRPSQEKRHVARSPARYFVRCNLFYPEKRQLNPKEFEARTIDLTEEGAALIIEQEVDTGAHLIIKFSVNNEMGNTLSSFRKVVIFTGTLVYSSKIGPRAYRVGVSFHPGQAEDNEDKYYDIICSPAYYCPGPDWDMEMPGERGSRNN